MMLLCILIPVGSHQVPRSHGTGVVYKVFERSAVTKVELIIDSRTNVFGASYEVDMF